MTDTSAMAGGKPLSQIYPGRGLGWMNLGASLHGVLSRLKSQPHAYPELDLSYSSLHPILEPVILNLPVNGVRLRFDGPDQRLRLIEIMDFSRTTFTYKNTEVVRLPSSSEHNAGTPPAPVSGPSFRHIYNRLFGPAYAGEYTAPESGQSEGTYVLSYPGLAVRFSLRHKSYSDKADFVSLLTAAASPALSIAIFSGSSWPEARKDLYTRMPTLPRSIALVGKNSETVADEIENVIIRTGGRLELIRRSSAPFEIQLSETTPQDLVAELGPPDAIFRKTSSRLSIHAASQPIPSREAEVSPGLHPSSVDSNRSLSAQSLNSGLEDDSDSEHPSRLSSDSAASTEMFYNYFHHGFDVLISYPSAISPSLVTDGKTQQPSTEHKLVATKFFLHANVPGSYSFNRHRRSRWVMPLPETVIIESAEQQPAPIHQQLREEPSAIHKQTSTAPNIAPPAPPQASSLQPTKSKSKSKKSSLSNQITLDVDAEDFSSSFNQSYPYSTSSSSPSPPKPSNQSEKLNLPVRHQRSSPSTATSSSVSASTSTPSDHGQTRTPIKISTLTSEHTFHVISQTLNQVWANSSDQQQQQYQRGMILNRGWSGDNNTSPESSIELLGGTMTMDDPTTATGGGSGGNSTTIAGGGGGGGGVSNNTQLFGFPGMLFEVLKNDVISCVTIY